MHEVFDQSINDHTGQTSREFNSEFSYVYHCSEKKCSQDEVLQFQQILKINIYKYIQDMQPCIVWRVPIWGQSHEILW